MTTSCKSQRARVGRFLVAALLLACLPACSYLESEFSTLNRMPAAFERGAPDEPRSVISRP